MAEHHAIRSVGFSPVGQVLGSCVYAIGWTGSLELRHRLRLGRRGHDRPHHRGHRPARLALRRPRRGDAADAGRGGPGRRRRDRRGAAHRRPRSRAPGWSSGRSARPSGPTATSARRGRSPPTCPARTSRKLIAAGWVPAELVLGIAVAVRHDDWRTRSSTAAGPGPTRRSAATPSWSTRPGPTPAARLAPTPPGRRRRDRRRPRHEPADPPALVRGRQRRRTTTSPRRRSSAPRSSSSAPRRERADPAPALAAPHGGPVTDPAQPGSPRTRCAAWPRCARAGRQPVHLGPVGQRVPAACARPGSGRSGWCSASSIYHVGFQVGRWSKNQELDTLSQAMYHARELAMTRMEAEADQLGADGIVGVRLDDRVQGVRLGHRRVHRRRHRRQGRPPGARGRPGATTATSRSPPTCPARTSGRCCRPATRRWAW